MNLQPAADVEAGISNACFRPPLPFQGPPGPACRDRGTALVVEQARDRPQAVPDQGVVAEPGINLFLPSCFTFERKTVILEIEGS
jgi:hypothetical protein